MAKYEIVTLGPKYAIRISDMEPADKLRLTCFLCGHLGYLSVDTLLIKHQPFVRLTAIETNVPCSQCGNKLENYWQIVRPVEDPPTS